MNFHQYDSRVINYVCKTFMILVTWLNIFSRRVSSINDTAFSVLNTQSQVIVGTLMESIMVTIFGWLTIRVH